jgi:hypothetical protein
MATMLGKIFFPFFKKRAQDPTKEKVEKGASFYRAALLSQSATMPEDSDDS